MEGVEIVITPRIIERIVLSLVIVALVVFIIVKILPGNSIDEESNSSSSEKYSKTLAANANLTSQNDYDTSVIAGITPCTNKIRDSGETDVDCGGTCGPCLEYSTCNVNDDCAEGLYCFQHIKCLKPTCDDGIKNQDETNVDCGGACSGFWWIKDNRCHTSIEPSGELDVLVSAVVDKSPNSGNAIIKSITLKFDNGLESDLAATLTIFIRTANGGTIFENKDGEIAVQTLNVNVKSGSKDTKIIDLTENTRSVLPGIQSTDKFQIVVVAKDTLKKTLINEYYWSNE